MILIGQTIMSPNGDRNSILIQCEFSVDFSFLRSLRASQLDAIYYILININVLHTSHFSSFKYRSSSMHDVQIFFKKCTIHDCMCHPGDQCIPTDISTSINEDLREIEPRVAYQNYKLLPLR